MAFEFQLSGQGSFSLVGSLFVSQLIMIRFCKYYKLLGGFQCSWSGFISLNVMPVSVINIISNICIFC